METRQILIIKHSWSFILLEADLMDKMGTLFYQTLFLDFPSLKMLFHHNVAAQTHKFMGMMTFLVARMQYPNELAGEIQALAQRHVAYGVQAVDYDLVGHVLLKTLARVLQDRWTPELEEAWTYLYRSMAQTMQNSLSTAP